jgi:hypothetical protein
VLVILPGSFPGEGGEDGQASEQDLQAVTGS